MDSIVDDVRWLTGSDGHDIAVRYTSDYFDVCFKAAIHLIHQVRAMINTYFFHFMFVPIDTYPLSTATGSGLYRPFLGRRAFCYEGKFNKTR
jgi:hypothetical protein